MVIPLFFAENAEQASPARCCWDCCFPIVIDALLGVSRRNIFFYIYFSSEILSLSVCDAQNTQTTKYFSSVVKSVKKYRDLAF